MYNCANCGILMPEERVLAGLLTCKNCTPQVRKVGFEVCSHKTAPELVILDGIDREQVRLAQNANERRR